MSFIWLDEITHLSLSQRCFILPIWLRSFDPVEMINGPRVILIPKESSSKLEEMRSSCDLGNMSPPGIPCLWSCFSSSICRTVLLIRADESHVSPMNPSPNQLFLSLTAVCVKKSFGRLNHGWPIALTLNIPRVISSPCRWAGRVNNKFYRGSMKRIQWWSMLYDHQWHWLFVCRLWGRKQMDQLDGVELVLRSPFHEDWWCWISIRWNLRALHPVTSMMPSFCFPWVKPSAVCSSVELIDQRETTISTTYPINNWSQDHRTSDVNHHTDQRQEHQRWNETNYASPSSHRSSMMWSR